MHEHPSAMASPADVPPFLVSPILSGLYHHAPDLLDLSAPGPSSSSPRRSTSPQPPSISLPSSATSVAAAAASAAARPGPGGHVSSVPEHIDEVVRCVEGYGENLYVGRSDGVVEWWALACDGASGARHNGWTLRHRHALFPRRPVTKLVILPQVSRVLVLSDGTLHPLTLPGLETLPSTVMQPLRGIVSVVLDDEELEWGGPGSEDKTAEMTLVVVRRKGLGIYRLGTRLVAQKEIPLPSPPVSHALSSRYLCAALPHSSTYALIDLSDASLTEVLPVSHVDTSDLDFVPNPNVVVIPGENEFLVTSYTGVSTMGVFLNGQGDPVRGTIEWPEHPVSMAVDSGYIIALLRNHIISIHAISDLDRPVQTIQLDPSFNSFSISYSPYCVSARDVIRDDRMRTGRITLLEGKLAPEQVSARKHDERPGDELPPGQSPPPPPDTSPVHEEPPSGSGLTPPSSPPPPSTRKPTLPARESSLIQATAPTSRGPFSTSVAETLIVGPHGIQAVAPTPIVLRLEQLCTERRTEEAMAAVDNERRKGRRGEMEGDKATHQATLRLLHLYLACHLMLETMFEKAGEYFLRGKIDPRLLVRVFPIFRGKVIGSAEEVEVYEGLRQVLIDMPPIDKIIATSIKRNYSPHVSPSTSQAPETIELREALEGEAKRMLTEFLRKTRQSRRKGGGGRGVDSRKIDIVIDSTLAKLLADASTTNELLALLAAPNDAVLSELEPFLGKRPYVLATVMRQQQRFDRVLEILKGIAESDDGDPLCQDPVDEIAQQLESVKDPDMFRTYVLWIAERSPDKAFNLLVLQNTKTGIKLNDVALVADLRRVSQDTADRYLEYAVVARRNPNRELHEALLEHLLDEIGKEVQDDGVKYHLEELDADYRLSSDSQPFYVFLADVAPPTPIKFLRLRLVLFLQGSPFFDLAKAASRLESIPQLKSELAIVLGKQGRNKQALRLLARDIGDAVSAQTYCTQGGEIVPPKVAHMVAQLVPELVGWATLGDVGRKRRGTVDAKTQEGLVMDLLGVYMQEGSSATKQAAALLNAQSVHMDAMDILSLVPNEWPLDAVSTFFQRTLRRELHDRAFWQILKSISAGQNLAMSEIYLDSVTSLPPMMVAGLAPNPSPGLSAPDEGSIAEKEDGPGGGGDKMVEVVSEKDGGEAGGDDGFFSQEDVQKELAGLGVVEAREGRVG